jgi:hypothetical protein
VLKNKKFSNENNDVSQVVVFEEELIGTKDKTTPSPTSRGLFYSGKTVQSDA